MPCTDRSQCDPDTDCTTWACVAGNCSSTFLPDETPVKAGTVGDCKKNVCKDGKPAVLNDDSDVGADSDPCKIEMCNGGVKQSMAAPDGTKCGATGNLGCVSGHCEGCVMNAANCDPSTDCKEATCPDNTCVYTIREGKVTDVTSPTDCKVEVCDANGNKTIKGDTSETPPQVDNNCKTEVCAMDGSVAEVNEADGAKCANAMGKCYNDSTCVAGTCTEQPIPTGIKIGDDGTPNNCKAEYCDGMGKVVVLADPMDLPVDPMPDDCTVAICNGDMPSTSTKPAGAGCGGGNKCCGTNCCAVTGPGYCDGNSMCCASGQACGGTCCQSNNAACLNNQCCETAIICGGACCPSTFPCQGDTGACCPNNKKCGANLCCNSGQSCMMGGTVCM